MRPAAGDAHVDKAIDQLGRPRKVHDPVIAGAPGELIGGFFGQPLHQHAFVRAHHALGDGRGLRLDLRLQPPQPRALCLVWNFVRQLRGGRPGPRAVEKTERVVELELLGELERRLAIGLALAREADDEVRAHADLGTRAAQAAHDRAVFERGIAALHRGEDAIGARLHRQVHVRRELRQRGVRIDQALGEVARMRGGVADALDAVDFGYERQQLGEIGRACADAVAPGVHVLAEQRYLLHTLTHQHRNLGHDIGKGARHFLAARVRHHAEAAVLAAAFHDRDVGAGALDARRGQVGELLDQPKADVDLRLAPGAALLGKLPEAGWRLRAADHVYGGATLAHRTRLLAPT